LRTTDFAAEDRQNNARQRRPQHAAERNLAKALTDRHADDADDAGNGDDERDGRKDRHESGDDTRRLKRLIPRVRQRQDVTDGDVGRDGGKNPANVVCEQRGIRRRS